eukprot:514941_1
MSQKVVFVVGQIVHAEDRWYDAIIKEVRTNNIGERVVKVGWINDKWKNEEYDKVWTENEWDQYIRDPKTKLPYSCSKDNVKLLKNDIKHKTNMVNSLKRTVSKHQAEIVQLNIRNSKENSLKTKLSEL